jgi:hypothetical protein
MNIWIILSVLKTLQFATFIFMYNGGKGGGKATWPIKVDILEHHKGKCK